MAALMMANEGQQPVFHDFLGMSYSESATILANKSSSGLVSGTSLGGGASHGRPELPILVAGCASTGVTPASSDLGSERQTGNNFEGFPKSDFSGPEISNRFSGRKRSNSDSSFVGPMRDRMMGTDVLDSSCLMKMFRNEGRDERLGRPPDDEFFCAMQPPKPTPNAPRVVQSSMSSRTDLVVPKWDASLAMNTGPMSHYRSRFGPCGTYVDKVSSSTYRDASVGPLLISRPAADEGSRTGIKGSGIANVIKAASGGVERNSSGTLPSIIRASDVPQNTEPEAAKQSSHHIIASAGQQMTIFYAGQAHVFDDVHRKKADAIMALAGSSGRSWSTTYSSKSSTCAAVSEAYVPGRENETGGSNLAFPQELRNRLPVAVNSSHGYSHGGRVSSLGDQNLPSGEHRAAGPAKEAKATMPMAEGDSEGK